VIRGVGLRARRGGRRSGAFLAALFLLITTVLVPIARGGPAAAADPCTPDPVVDTPVLTPLDTNIASGVTFGERVKVEMTVEVACAITANLAVTQVLSAGLVWLADTGGLVGVSSSSTGFGSPDPLAAVLTSANPVTASTLTVTIPPVTPSGTLPVNPTATIHLTAVAIVAHPATGPFTDLATAGPSTATSAGLALVSPPSSYTMAKTANPNLNVAAGTDVAFAITATPTVPANSSPAYGVTITDTLPAGFTLDHSTDLATAVTDNGTCAGTMATPTLSGQTLTMSWAGPVPANCALSVAYSGVFAASASVTSVNTANLSDQSQPGTGTQSVITGAGDTTPAVFHSGPATASVCTAAPTFGTAAVQIGSNQPAIIPPNVTVGEEVSFTVTVNIPCAATATVVETLDPGLVWLATNVSGVLVPSDASSSGTNLPALPDPTKFMATASVQPGGAGNVLLIPFGALSPTGSGAIVTLKASALVEDTAAVKSGNALHNSLSLNWGAAAPATKTATVNVVEPDLTSFTKTASATIVNQPPNPAVDYSLAADFAATGSPAYGMVLQDGLTPDLTIQSMSDTTTPAACKAADGLSLTPPFPTSAGGGIILHPNPLPTVATGACQLSIAYTGQFATNAAINQTNSATLVYQSLDSSLAKTSAATPSGVSTAPRVYSDAKSETTTQINSASIAASYNVASTNVSIGQKIPIALTVNLPKGGAQGVSVTYTLPAGMAFASVGGALAGLVETLNGAPVTPTPAAVALSSPAQSVTIPLGKVTAAGPGGFPTMTLAFDAIVLDSAPPPTTLAGGGATLSLCDPTLANCPPPKQLTTPSGSPGALTVVTPVLTEATLMSPSTVQPGDPVTFTIALQHDPASTGDAHDVTVTIPLSGWTLLGQCAEVDNLGAMASCSQNAGGDVVVQYNDHTVAGALVAAIPTIAPTLPGPPAAQAKFTFTATAPGTTPPSGQVTTTWESAPSLTSQSLDPEQVNADAHPHTSTLHGGDFSLGVTAPTVTKSVSNPNLGGGHATIGDKVVYTVTFTLPHLPSTSHGLTLTDTLGPGLAFADTPAPASPCGSGPVAGSVTAGNPLLVTTSLGAFSCALAAANVALTPPANPTEGSKLVLSLGDVTNADTTTTDETITFTYTAIVLDTPANRAATNSSPATQVTNSVAMSYKDDAGIVQPAASQTSTLTIVEPSLTLDDQAQPLPADAGVNGPNLAGVRYQMTVTNTSTTASAFNVIISQDIPAGLNLDPNPALCNAAFVTPPATTSVPTPVTCTAVPIGTTKAFTLHASAIGPLLPGQQIVFSYTIDVIPGFFPTAISLPPTLATVDWTSQGGPPLSLTSNGPPGPSGSTYAKQRTGPTNPPGTTNPAPIPGADNYETTGSSVVTLTLAALTLAAPSPAAAPVGSEVTMSATITLPEAFTNPTPAPRQLTGLDLQATLPSGLCYEAGSLTTVLATNVTSHVPGDAALNTVSCKPPTVAGAAVPAPIPGPTSLDFRFGCPATPAPVLPCSGETDVNPTATPPPANANTIKLTWKVIVLTNPGTPTSPGTLSTPASLLLDGHAPIVGTAMDITAQEPQLKVTTSWGVGQGEPNQTAPASVTIMNIGTSPANNIAATLGFTNATPPSQVTVNGPSGTCATPPVPTAGGISFAVGTLGAGASVTCAFSPTIQLPAVLTAGAKATLAASITTTTLDDATDPYDRVEAPVTQQSDLLISLTTVTLAGTMTAVGDPFKPGGPARFTLTISNNSAPGSANATMNALGIDIQSDALPGLVLSPNVGDVAPAGVAPAGAHGAGTVKPAAALTWNAFTLSPGAAVTASVNGTVPLTAAAGPVSVTATITAVNAVNTGTSSVVGTATVQPAVDLVASVSRAGPFVAGVQGTYVLALTNKGPSAAGAVTLTDTLPTGIAFVSAKGTGWTCKAGIICSLPSLAAGASTSVTVTVLIDLATGAQVINSFSATTANDVNTANNTATDQTTVQPSSVGSAGHGSSVLTGTAASATGSAAASPAATGALAMTGAFLRQESLLALLFFGLGTILALAPRRRRQRRQARQSRRSRPAPTTPPFGREVASSPAAVLSAGAGASRPLVRSRLLRRGLPAIGLAAIAAFFLGRHGRGPGD
jgi:large repetitive protein